MNVGDDRMKIQEVFAFKKLPWRSFFFGQNYAVPDLIGINGYPTYIQLDSEHKIRSITHQIDYQALEDLLADR
jgi:hypothetical protein